MSYPKIPGVDKAERARRRRQEIGGKKVPRYAWSPYTAQAGERYAFYADVELSEIIESPFGVKTKNITVLIIESATFLEFRNFVREGRAYQHIVNTVKVSRGELYEVQGYWRSVR